MSHYLTTSPATGAGYAISGSDGLSAAEQQRILYDWNATRVDHPPQRYLHRMFEAQAERAPEATAVVCGDQVLTYGELNGLANQLAHSLARAGIGPDRLVALCLERSTEMVIAMLAIMKAGGAYVPLDPAYPSERLAFMLADCQASILLTQRRLLRELPAGATRPVFVECGVWGFAQESRTNLSVALAPENLAYVIYTSGSTGRPKGVMITHDGLGNYLHWATTAYAVAAGSGAPVHSSCAFDLTVTSLFCPLVAGRRVVLVPESKGVEALCAVLRAGRNFSLIKITPAHLKLLAQELKPEEAARCTRALVIGGEALSAEHLTFWRTHAPHVRLINEYGPTETVVGCCIYEVPPGAAATGPIPIGRPIANTEMYILDENCAPVPIGATGEIYIGGTGVARGYLNRPELTTEKFIAHPFRKEPGARLYKTGDLARYRSDGVIEYLGRVDDQVKLRGYRIEPGEIEAAIRSVEGVREVAVVVREVKPGDQRLVAHVVPQRPSSCTAHHIRALLRTKLPDYMVPASFVFLPELPLTPNGKVDRRALPQPALDGYRAETPFVACRTATERWMARTWEEVLSVARVGAFDNFFDLGGDSLLGLRVILRIEKAFGKTLPLARVYETPTVEGLSRAVDELDGRARHYPSLIALQPNGSRTPFFMIHGEASNAFLPRHLAPDQPLYGIKHQGEDGWEARYTTVEDIAAHYLSEIRTVQPDGPYLLGGYCFGGLVALEIAQQLRRQNQRVSLLFLLAPCKVRTAAREGAGSATVAAAPRASWSDEFRRLLNKFKSCDRGEKAQRVFAWIAAKIKARAVNAIEHASRNMKELLCRIYRRLGWRLPLRLRNLYILGVYDEAVKRYVAAPYCGRVILFKPVKDAVDVEAWKELIATDLQIREVPGNHGDVLSNPAHVKIWGEALMEHLDASSRKTEPNVYSVPAVNAVPALAASTLSDGVFAGHH